MDAGAAGRGRTSAAAGMSLPEPPAHALPALPRPQRGIRRPERSGGRRIMRCGQRQGRERQAPVPAASAKFDNNFLHIVGGGMGYRRNPSI